MNESYPGKEVLDLVSKYALNRNKAIWGLIRNYLPEISSRPRILEVGAGKGEFIDRFSTSINAETFAVDADPEYREILSKRHRAFSRVDEVPGSFDYIFLIDVLEHVEDDRQMLREVYNKLVTGGHLFIYVPARQELFSDFDRRIGHFRRYQKAELVSAVKSAGFSIGKCRYHEMLGYLAAGLNKLFPGNKIPGRVSIMFYDKILVPATNWLEKGLNPPIGKSLYLMAKKGETGSANEFIDKPIFSF